MSLVKILIPSLAGCCLAGAVGLTQVAVEPGASCCVPPATAAATGVVVVAAAQTQPGGQMPMAKAPDFHVMGMSKYGFDDTVQILKGAIEQQNLMVVHEIDAQRMLRMVGEQTKGMKQILFFHPRYMNRIRDANPHATIEPPLKIAVMERPDGKVMVRYIRPMYLFGRYDGLDEIGKELEGVTETIVAETTK